MDIINLWCETGDKEKDELNIVKSWLCGSTDGQTYSVTDNILDFDVEKIEEMGYCYEFPEEAFDIVLGFRHDFCVDSPNLEDIAKTIVKGLHDLSNDVNEHPEKYFQKNTKKFLTRCSAHKGVCCDYCLGEDNECSFNDFCPFKRVCEK